MFSKNYRHHFGQKPWNGNSPFFYSQNIFIPICSHLQRSRRRLKEEREKKRCFIQQQNLLVTIRKWPKSLISTFIL